MALGTSWTNIGSQSCNINGYTYTTYVYAKLNHQDSSKSYVDLELRLWVEAWLRSYDTDFYLHDHWLGYAYREWMTNGATYTIMSYSITVQHDSNGEAAFRTTGGYEFKGMGVSATTFQTGWVGLPKINVNYTVSFNGNGSTTNVPSSITQAQGTAITIPAGPTWTGHTFSGWNTAQNGTGTMYQQGDSYMPNTNVTLYAQWGLQSYTITFNANNGTGAPNSQTKIYGQTTYLSPITPTRDGYTFFRWNTAANGTGQDYSPAGPFNVNADTILYATWIQNAAPPDVIHDCYINIRDTWVPGFAYINVGGTWYFVKRTGLKVSSTWKDVSNKF